MKPPLIVVAAGMPDGKVFTYEGATWVRDAEPYVAIGSGAACSLAAMDFGAFVEGCVSEPDARALLDHEPLGRGLHWFRHVLPILKTTRAIAIKHICIGQLIKRPSKKDGH
jgi:hypothetical protein